MEKNEQHTELFADVILPLAVPPYTYAVPSNLQGKIQVGCRVVVQLGLRKMYTAIVCELHNRKPQIPNVKQVDSVIDEIPIVTPKQLQLWQWIADYYICTLGEVMKAALPSGLKLESESQLAVNANFDCLTLNESDRNLYELIEHNDKITIQDLAKMVGKKSISTQIQRLISIEAISVGESISNQYKPKLKPFVVLSQNSENKAFVEESFAKVARAGKQQEAFLWILSEAIKHKSDEQFAIPKSEIPEQFSAAVVQELQKKEIIRIENRSVSRLESHQGELKGLVELSKKQQIAIDEIRNSFSEKNTCLLHGVTSSGKTEIYIHLIQEQISAGKQVLYLLPEIALTSQIINRLRSVFGNKVGVYHSRFSDNERVEVWTNILQQNEQSYQIILGVRSSIFLPFNNLGLVIVDEEHETSFKQYDPSPRYNARDVAYILSQMYGAKLLLGTATPSMETYYNVLAKRIGLVELFSRHTKAPLPQIHIIDLRKERRQLRMQDVFSKTLLEKIAENLNAHRQVILFQNRRGFSPYLECPDCGNVPRCINCDVSLTYHKFSNTLQCHHCGYSIRYTTDCPECGGKNMNLAGFGTEKIEDQLKETFPQARVARMDLDTTRGKHAYSELISKFERKEIDILVGTQMITKGLDFENVGLVGILNADSLLKFPDFRASERAYQLMVQVAGRAGRSETQGQVYIQATQVDNPVLDFVKNNNYTALLNTQMQDRNTYWYPPFTRLIRITVKHREREKAMEAAKIVAENFRTIPNTKVLGPEFPLIPRIQNLYAQEILMKIPRNQNITKIREQVRIFMNEISTNEVYKSTQFSINVDPY